MLVFMLAKPCVMVSMMHYSRSKCLCMYGGMKVKHDADKEACKLGLKVLSKLHDFFLLKFLVISLNF